MSDFVPTVHEFKVDKLDELLRGHLYAYIDLVDDTGIVHPQFFDYCGGIKFKLKTVFTNREYIIKSFRVAVIFIRSRNKIDDIQKVAEKISETIAATDKDIFDLYVRAHEEGIFAELPELPPCL